MPYNVKSTTSIAVELSEPFNEVAIAKLDECELLDGYALNQKTNILMLVPAPGTMQVEVLDYLDSILSTEAMAA